MKVLMIEYFYPENSYTQDLGKELTKYSDLTIACKKHVILPDDGLRWKHLIYEGYHSRLTAPLLYGLSLAQLGWDIWKNRYDVVNIQYMREPKYEIKLFRMLRRRYGILADTIHTLIPHEADERDKDLHRYIYSICDLLIVHNQTCRHRLIDEYGVPDEKICVMPHGLYTVEQRPMLRPENDTVRFLMFGQMRKYKGIDVLIEAVSKIPPEYRDRVRVTIAGPQYKKIDDTDYEAMAKQFGVGDIVTLIPRHIPKEKHAALFDNADICILPYKELYGSGSLIMSYAFEKPVIVSDDPIFREETDDGQTGIMFRKNDAQALADAMVKTLDWTPEEFEAFRQHIREMSRGKFSWARSARIIYEAYTDRLKALRRL